MSVLEKVLAERLGVDRAVLRKKRRAAPEGSTGQDQGGIFWTVAGVDWLYANLAREGDGGVSAGVAPSAGEIGPPGGGDGSLAGIVTDKDGVTGSNGAPPASPVILHEEIVVLQVTKNRRLLAGERGNGERVRIKVRDNVNFVRGMVLPCVHQTLDLWCLNGKLPSRRGKGYRHV